MLRISLYLLFAISSPLFANPFTIPSGEGFCLEKIGTLIDHKHDETHLERLAREPKGCAIKEDLSRRDDKPPSPPKPRPEPTLVGETAHPESTVIVEYISEDTAPSRELEFPPTTTQTFPEPEPQGKIKKQKPLPPALQHIQVTEYMMRDGGQRGLPTWIELHNPNAIAVVLDGWTFTWATRRFVNSRWHLHTHTLNHSIPAEGVVLLVSKTTRHFEGIEDSQVHNLGIQRGRLLKNGWKLTDAAGTEVFSIGRAFGKGSPVLAGSWNARKSHQRYPSESPATPHYYGNSGDSGSPGFYQELTPNAPRLIRPKRLGIWAKLRKE